MDTSISVTLDTCIVSKVWYFVGFSYRPEPFRLWIESTGSGGYFLGENNDIPVTFQFRRTDGSSKDVLYNQILSGVPGNTSDDCSAMGYQLIASFQINPAQVVYGGTYSGDFILNAKWNHNDGFQDDVTDTPLPFKLQLKIPHIVQISGLKDLVLNKGSKWLGSNDQVCVFSSLPHSNGLVSQYSVQAESENAFNLVMNENAKPVPYTLEWKDGRENNWQTLTTEVLKGQWGSLAQVCPVDSLSGVRVTVATDLSGAAAGIYTDHVMITVRPE